MTVAAILANKGRSIVTIRPEMTISEACDLLSQHRIGAVVASRDKETIDGILSERDIVRALARDGASALDRPVSYYMTRTVETVTVANTVAEVMERMTAGRFRHMPIVEDGRLIGLVSIGDIVKHRIAAAESEAEQMRNYIAMA